MLVLKRVMPQQHTEAIYRKFRPVTPLVLHGEKNPATIVLKVENFAPVPLTPLPG